MVMANGDGVGVGSFLWCSRLFHATLDLLIVWLWIYLWIFNDVPAIVLAGGVRPLSL
jgi:hypothetical protein